MIRAARLDATIYEQIKTDKTALSQSMVVVVLSGVAGGLGNPSVSMPGPQNLAFAIICAFVSWLMWAWLIYLIGTKILPEPQTKTSVNELLRTIGFSSSPGILWVLGVFQPLAGIIGNVVGVWILCAIIIAVRQTLDYKSIGRAVGVCVIVWLIFILTMFLLAVIGLRA